MKTSSKPPPAKRALIQSLVRATTAAQNQTADTQLDKERLTSAEFRQRSSAAKAKVIDSLIARYLPFLKSSASPLQRAAVIPATELQYVECLMCLQLWLLENGLSPTCRLEVDRMVTAYFQDLVADNIPPHQGSKLLAALMHFYPGMGTSIGSCFPESTRALRGWHRRMPAKSRAPLPFIGLVLILLHQLMCGEVAEALATLLSFSLYLRPRECSGLSRGQLVAPQPLGEAHFDKWAVVLHPLESQLPSKVGVFDESLLIDSPYMTQWVVPFLHLLTEQRGKGPLWPPA